MPESDLAANRYVQDILAQPKALRNTLTALKDAGPLHARVRQLAGDARRIVLTGMGASFHALHPLTLSLIDHGLWAQMMETSELVHYAPALIASPTLLIVVSQSGRSAEVLRLIEIARNQGAPLIAVTNSANSPLAAEADAALLTRAGAESSVSSKTYITALAGLAWLGDALIGRPVESTLAALDFVPRVMEEYLALWRAHVDKLCERLADVCHLVLVGRGPSLAAVGTGALIIKEAAHFPAEGMSSAAYRHGPLDMASSHQFVLVFQGARPTARLNTRLAEDIRRAGGQAEIAGEDASLDFLSLPPGPEFTLPLLEFLPVQMVSLALAQLQGHEAGHFEHSRKVTTTE